MDTKWLLRNPDGSKHVYEYNTVNQSFHDKIDAWSAEANRRHEERLYKRSASRRWDNDEPPYWGTGDKE